MTVEEFYNRWHFAFYAEEGEKAKFRKDIDALLATQREADAQIADALEYHILNEYDHRELHVHESIAAAIRKGKK